MASKSQISKIVANQLGNIQGQLEARILNEVVRIQSKFTNKCPDSKELVSIINTRNSLLKSINSFQKLTNKFGAIPKSLQGPIAIAKIVIRLLKANPTPLAIGTPPGPSGGLLFAQQAGFVTSQADKLQKLSILLEDLESDVSALNNLIGTINPSLNNVKKLLENINLSITDCVENLGGDEETAAKELLSAVRPISTKDSLDNPENSTEYIAANGNPYYIFIEDYESSTDIALKRIAVAKNTSGITVMRGEPSFSSDAQILIDEVKFRLDNQLA